MDQNRTSPSASTQHRNTGEQPDIDSQDGTTHAPAPQNQTAGTTTTHANPFVHPLMIPQLNPLYWPYVFNFHPMVNPFVQFPFGPQVPLLVSFPRRGMVLSPAIHGRRSRLRSASASQRHSARYSSRSYCPVHQHRTRHFDHRDVQRDWQ
jgi:hypothetical protein